MSTIMQKIKDIEDEVRRTCRQMLDAMLLELAGP